MGRAAYEIRTAGQVPRQALEDFHVVSHSVDPAGTTFHVLLADDAQLAGVLEALGRGGHVLVDAVRQVFDDPGTGPPGPGEQGSAQGGGQRAGPTGPTGSEG